MHIVCDIICILRCHIMHMLQSHSVDGVTSTEQHLLSSLWTDLCNRCILAVSLFRTYIKCDKRRFLHVEQM